jgi:hypothetical protein
VHIHGIGPALVTNPSHLGLRIIVIHHGEDYNREKRGWAARTVLRLGEALGMRFAHERIAISRSIEKLIADKYGKSCEVIPKGVVFADPPSQTDKVVEVGTRTICFDSRTTCSQEAANGSFARSFRRRH